VAILWDETPNSRLSVQELEAAARTLGLGIHPVGVRGPNEFARAFSAAAGERALIVVASPFMFTERKRIADLALKHRLPTAVGGREYAEAGGLFSYAVSYPDLFRRAASYVDKILSSDRGVRRAKSPAGGVRVHGAGRGRRLDTGFRTFQTVGAYGDQLLHSADIGQRTFIAGGGVSPSRTP
jgi:ABC-type uncharacterized transport system substrate-binding protein